MGKKEVAVVKVDGMMCVHCAGRVKEALKKIENVKDVDVNLDKKEVSITYKNSLDFEKVKIVINELGYKFIV